MRFGGDAEILGLPVDSLFNNNSWGSGGGCDFLDGGSKLLLEGEEEMTKVTMETLDSMLLGNSPDGSLAELKPLPPFTGYTGHLSINGISGHHYHAIANQQPPSPTPSLEASSNNNIASTASSASSTTSNNSTSSVMYKNNGATLYYEVSTTAPEQGVVSSSVDCVPEIKMEPDYNSLLPDDIAELIGSAIADTTVPSVVDGLNDADASRDSWMDVFFDGSDNNNKSNGANSDFASCDSESVTLQQLLQHGSQYGIHTEVLPKQEPSSNYPSNMSLLQSRLQNGPPSCKMVQEHATSSTSYLNGNSPPGHVSTTENLLLNGRFIQNRNRSYPPYRGALKVPSPDMLVTGNSLDSMVTTNFPHTTTSNLPSKKSRNRGSKKNSQMVFDGIGILGKEKPIHRCSICSRGFLNKSNIKVHLRTHTGEKPFSCNVCNKPFRQKAHLIKHQQMHKRVGRD